MGMRQAGGIVPQGNEVGKKNELRKLLQKAKPVEKTRRGAWLNNKGTIDLTVCEPVG